MTNPATRIGTASETISLSPTSCALCDTKDNATQLYPANFTVSDLNPEIFSARRLPDKIHYRIVQCNQCGLLRSDPVADATLLDRLYKASSFDYSNEVEDLKKTYRRYLNKINRFSKAKNSLLEIGCGNGFFLEEALQLGYMSIRGLEPSGQAISKASCLVAPHIVCDVMKPGLFEPESFDVVCFFQALDHIPDPNAFLRECFRILKPGGFVLCLNHNATAFSARLMGEKSPIVDIEHTYLYSPKTISALFRKHNFTIKEIGSATNTNSLFYLTRLVPFPAPIKNFLLHALRNSFLGRIRLSLPLGNLYCIGQKCSE